MDACLFCKIVRGEIKPEIIYQDDHAIAFLDVNPLAPGHTLVIPKLHAPQLTDLTDSAVGPLFLTVKKITAILANTLHSDGFTIGMNQGEAGHAGVDHLHIHLIPRFTGDKGGSLHTIVNNKPKKSTKEIAELIRATIQ